VGSRNTAFPLLHGRGDQVTHAVGGSDHRSAGYRQTACGAGLRGLIGCGPVGQGGAAGYCGVLSHLARACPVVVCYRKSCRRNPSGPPRILRAISGHHGSLSRLREIGMRFNSGL
jgi:hypothetical protein